MGTTDTDGQTIAAHELAAVNEAPGRADEIRIGDGDRAAADRLLGEHVTAGRLTSTEYAERATQAMSARARGDITGLFRDLPAPHPHFDGPAVTPGPGKAPEPAEQAAPRPSASSPRQARHLRYAAMAVAAPCALFGALGGLSLAAEAPSLLLLVFLVIAGVYGLLVFVDNRRFSRHDQ